MNKQNKKMSFRRGWNRVPYVEKAGVRAEIMDALGIRTKQGFWYRMTGVVNHSKEEYDTIARIFRNHGLVNIWGE